MVIVACVALARTHIQCTGVALKRKKRRREQRELERKQKQRLQSLVSRPVLFDDTISILNDLPAVGGCPRHSSGYPSLRDTPMF